MEIYAQVDLEQHALLKRRQLYGGASRDKLRSQINVFVSHIIHHSGKSGESLLETLRPQTARESAVLRYAINSAASCTPDDPQSPDKPPLRPQTARPRTATAERLAGDAKLLGGLSLFKLANINKASLLVVAADADPNRDADMKSSNASAQSGGMTFTGTR